MVGATQPCPFVIKSENKKMEVMNDIKKTQVDCTGVNSYVGQWNKYFDVEGNLAEHLKSITYNQSLRGCHFRSVCWRVFLNCLPPNINEWTEALSKSRNEYDIIKEKHKMLPNNETQNVDVENPLSQSDQSVWKQYFQDQDLRNIIERDVKRTFPEMDYFSKEDVRRTMETILFCYAREHIKLSYRQGMHELLAPILFVLHCDLQGAFHAQDIGELPKIIQTLFQGKYVENDAYTMFCHLMAATNSWYSVNEVE
uniref:Rab-GAP TBC domain-containing protein n=1 Tax=Ciona savignyi TaxID=51511 RepID=H2Z5C4_CIOSA